MRTIRQFFYDCGILFWVFAIGTLIEIIRATTNVLARMSRSPFGRDARLVTSLVTRCAAAWFYIRFATHLRGGTVLIVLLIFVLLLSSVVYVVMFSDQLDQPRVEILMVWSGGFAVIGNVFWISLNLSESSWFYTKEGVAAALFLSLGLVCYMTARVVGSEPVHDTGVEFASLT